MSDFARFDALYAYDPDTGQFRRKRYGKRIAGKSRARPGDIVGFRTKSGYIRVGPVFAHRLAFLLMTGDWPKQVVDHINRDKADNRWCNLRDVSSSENLLNQGLSRNNRSGVVGVAVQQDGMFRACYRGKELGRFACLSAAKIARCAAESSRAINIDTHRVEA